MIIPHFCSSHAPFPSILCFFQDGLFLIGYLTGNIELHQSLDHESNTQHLLTVFIVVSALSSPSQSTPSSSWLLLTSQQDEGSPPLTTTVYITVNVTNAADAAPVFTNKFYYATVPEGVYSELVKCHQHHYLTAPLPCSSTIRGTQV